jgi:hypothetical protein
LGCRNTVDKLLKTGLFGFSSIGAGILKTLMQAEIPIVPAVKAEI